MTASMPFFSMVRRPRVETRRLTQRRSASSQKRCVCRLGRKRRRFLLLAWDTRLPTATLLPVTSQTRLIKYPTNQLVNVRMTGVPAIQRAAFIPAGPAQGNRAWCRGRKVGKAVSVRAGRGREESALPTLLPRHHGSVRGCPACARRGLRARRQVDLVELRAVLAQAHEERVATRANGGGDRRLDPCKLRRVAHVFHQRPAAVVHAQPERIVVGGRRLLAEPDVVSPRSRRRERQLHPAGGRRRRAV